VSVRLAKSGLLLVAVLSSQSLCKKKEPPPDDDITNPGRKAAAHVCGDPDALGCHVAHITDPDTAARTKAIDSLVAKWTAEEKAGKASEQKAYRDAVVPELAKAYSSGLLQKDDRKKVLELIVRLGDARATSALLDTLTKYESGQEDLARLAVRGLANAATDPSFPRDEALGKALMKAFGEVKWDVVASAEIGNAIADALATMQIPSTREKLVDVLKLKNDGQDNAPTKALTAYQVAAARALGGAGDKTVVAPMIEVMFDVGSRMVSRYDSASGTMVLRAAWPTQTLADAIADALSQIGEPAVDPLVPYALADDGDPAVKAVAAKYETFVPQWGTATVKTAYADLAARALPELPSVATKIDAKVRDDVTNEDDRARLLRVIATLPFDPPVLDALKEGFGKLKKPQSKTAVLATVQGRLDPLVTDWLVDVAKDGKHDAETRRMARVAALWLTPKAKLETVSKVFDAGALAAFDDTYLALVPTKQTCNPDVLSGDKLLRCREDPITYEYVVFKDAGPTYKDDLALVTEVLACDALGTCYREVVEKQLVEYAKVPSYKGTPDSARAGVKVQKALTMLATYGTEDDLLALAKLLPKPNTSTTSAGSLIMNVLDVGSKKGSAKIAAELEAQVRTLRESTSTPNTYQITALELLGRKLRARVAPPATK
jgi:hypothetical protein